MLRTGAGLATRGISTQTSTVEDKRQQRSARSCDRELRCSRSVKERHRWSGSGARLPSREYRSVRAANRAEDVWHFVAQKARKPPDMHVFQKGNHMTRSYAMQRNAKTCPRSRENGLIPDPYGKSGSNEARKASADRLETARWSSHSFTARKVDGR